MQYLSSLQRSQRFYAKYAKRTGKTVASSNLRNGGIVDNIIILSNGTHVLCDGKHVLSNVKYVFGHVKHKVCNVTKVLSSGTEV